MSVLNTFVKDLYSEIVKMSPLNSGFSNVTFLSNPYASDFPAADRAPYVVFNGTLSYSGKSHESEFYSGSFEFKLYHRDTILCGEMGDVFRQNFLHESVFRVFSIGRIEQKNCGTERIEEVGDELDVLVFPVEFPVIVVDRVQGQVPNVYQ